MILQDDTLKNIETEIGRFPHKRSAMMNVLHLIQEDIGYIPDEAHAWVADHLGVEPIQVLEVITFYPMFRREPVGKVHISICRTLSCALAGSYHVMERLKEVLKCELGGVSADGRFSLDWSECLGSCGSGPVVHVNGKLYECIKPEQMDALIADLERMVNEPAEAQPKPGTPAYMG